jgi:hypothetical protein
MGRKVAPPAESRYTGGPDQGGDPCSDTHHAVMYLPEGAAYAPENWLCAACGQPDGYHHRKASCGPYPPAASAHPLRVSWDEGVPREAV